MSNTKGYAAWDYWNRRIMVLTVNYQDARSSVDAERIKNPDVGADWFGVEAVEDMGKVPAHLVVQS